MNASILNSSQRSGDAFRLKHPITVGEAEWDQHSRWIFTMLVRLDLASYWTAHGPTNDKTIRIRPHAITDCYPMSNILERRYSISLCAGFDKLCPTEVQMPFLPVFTALFFLHTATTTTSFTLTTTTNAYIHTAG